METHKEGMTSTDEANTTPIHSPDRPSTIPQENSPGGRLSDNALINLDERPVNGWVWKQDGWLKLPLDAEEVDEGGTKVWHHELSRWMRVTGEGLDPDTSVSASQPSRAAESSTQSKWEVIKGRDRDGDIPEFDGKNMDRRTYYRKIEIWEATTGIEPSKRGPRLLGKMSGEAFEKLENVKATSLLVPDGVQKLIDHVEAAYEPVEDYRTGKVMDHFLKEFERTPGQEIVDYNLAWDRERNKAEKVAGKLPRTWGAHLYLEKMKLSTFQKTQVLTGSLGKFEVEALSKAALHSFPTMRGEQARKVGSARKATGKPPFKKKYFHKKKAHKAHEAHASDEDPDGEGEEFEEGSEEESGEGSSEGEDDEQEGNYDNVPVELEEAYAEATAFLTRAKKQRAEIEKARGFFKKGADPKKQGDGSKNLKSKLPCSKCGGFGHWHKDPECPMFDKPFSNDKKKGHKARKKKKKKKTRKKRAHVAFVTTTKGTNLPYVAYADTACAKSVGGQSETDELVAYCDKVGWPYKLVPDKEPFRFGPGKRIYSRQALLLAVIWAQNVIVLRISIVPPSVPFLISKFVLKRLGGILDLDNNNLVLNRLNQQPEPLHDLDTGHVGIELIKPTTKPPKVSDSTWELVASGEEVTVEREDFREKLAAPHKEHGTHVVVIPELSDRKVDFASESEEVPELYASAESESHVDDTQTESDSDAEDMYSEYYASLTSFPTSMTNRTRAAPLYNELAPGWRARARSELVPSYLRYAVGKDLPQQPGSFDFKGMADDSDAHMEHVRESDTARRNRDGAGKVAGKAGKDGEVDLVDGQSRTDRGGTEGAAGYDSSSGTAEGDGEHSEDEDQESQRSPKRGRKPFTSAAQGSVEDASGRHEERVDRSPDSFPRQSSSRRFGDSHSRPSGEFENTEFFSLDTGSDSEYECGGGPIRLDECSGRGSSDQARPLGRPLWKWAVNLVKGASDRSQTLVNKVLATSKGKTANVASEADFIKCTSGFESWTQATDDATHLDESVYQGLDNPVWRQTFAADTGEILESMPYKQDSQSEVPDGPRDILTTVWYGKRTEPRKAKVRHNLLKGVRTVAAVFLLEALVLLSAGAQWSGSWTQSLYGTGQADVWEVFGNHSQVTQTSERQGWLALEPLTCSAFGKPDFVKYVNYTLDYRSPRLVVMECPTKHWYMCTKPKSDRTNSARQHRKTIREAITPWLALAEQVGTKQVAEGRDFVLETPLNQDVLSHPSVKRMIADTQTSVADTNRSLTGRVRPTWWLTSSAEIASGLDVSSRNPLVLNRSTIGGASKGSAADQSPKDSQKH